MYGFLLQLIWNFFYVANYMDVILFYFQWRFKICQNLNESVIIQNSFRIISTLTWFPFHLLLTPVNQQLLIQAASWDIR